jgi:threonylcarbamoyladenosine tRNA methylthiotransferase MtaB
MPHLHLPLQSGSDSVLKRMSRRCKTKDFAELIASARSAVPDFNVTTDIIVGFPGETEEEWDKGYQFIESMGFGHTHIFSFSPREGTKAASLPDPVKANIIKHRSSQLHELAENMKQAFIQQHQGKAYPVLLEDKVEALGDGQYRYSGYTPNYLRVQLESDQPDIGNKVVRYQL